MEGQTASPGLQLVGTLRVRLWQALVTILVNHRGKGSHYFGFPQDPSVGLQRQGSEEEGLKDWA
jgi:hypothetical protein